MPVGSESTPILDALREKLERKVAKTVVVGLGYVGLPLAVACAKAGFEVTGIDRNRERVSQVNRGKSYIAEVKSEELDAVVRAGRLSSVSDFDCIAGSDVVAICVPTPLDKNKSPDVSYIEYVLDQAGRYLHAGQLVLLESTTYPGTTREVVVPRLTSLGLEVGRDICVAYAPERIDPGNKEFPVTRIPRVVGGITPRCGEIACLFYKTVLAAPIYQVSSPEVAEMTKIFENTFRIVNVSLVNELAQLCTHMGIDVWEVIDGAKTKPFGFMPFYPGPGVGGHCIPIDPFYLSWKAKEYGFTTRFIELAGDINDHMPLYVVSEVSDILNRYGKPIMGSKVLVVGLAFKRDVEDIRESASLKVAEELISRGAKLSYHDPYIGSIQIKGNTYKSLELTAEVLRDHDLVVIATDHTNVDYGLIGRSNTIIYDTRNAMRGVKAKHLYKLGTGRSAE